MDKSLQKLPIFVVAVKDYPRMPSLYLTYTWCSIVRPVRGQVLSIYRDKLLIYYVHVDECLQILNTFCGDRIKLMLYIIMYN